MSARLLRQSGAFLLFVWAAASLTFFLARGIPGDPALAIIDRPRSADIRRLQRAWQSDGPLAAQYVRFLGRLAVLDLGESLIDRRPVRASLLEYLPNTLQLALAALLLSVPLALLLGTQAAMGRKRRWRFLHAVFSGAGLSVPVFLHGLLLILVFAVGLGLLPISGGGGPAYLVLPACTLAMPLGAGLSRMVRTTLRTEARQPYVLLARAKGLTPPQIFWRHILPNAMLPILTTIGLQAGALLSGAIVVESVFSWPGLGTLLVTAVRQRDYPMVQGAVLLMASLYLPVNTVVDLACSWLDPRTRHGQFRPE